MLPRFHAPGLDPSRGDATIEEDEARHLTRVLRIGAAAEVAVFDGRGLEYRARVLTTGKDSVRVELIERLPAAPEARVALTLVQAVLKGERMDDVVRDATMMGVSAIVPVISSHVAVKTAVFQTGRPAARWRRVVLASAKQSRRATLPDVHEPCPFAEWLAIPASGERLLLVEPVHESAAHAINVAQAADESQAPNVVDRYAPASLRAWLGRPAPASASVIVGPEGGWSREEVESAIAAGCTPVTLGGLTLRADAVPIAAIAICRFVFGDL